jgi:hypothetical protein
MANISRDDLRKAICCKREIDLASGHNGSAGEHRRLYAVLDIREESYGLRWYVDINGTKTLYDGLSAAVRGYCND